VKVRRELDRLPADASYLHKVMRQLFPKANDYGSFDGDELIQELNHFGVISRKQARLLLAVIDIDREPITGVHERVNVQVFGDDAIQMLECAEPGIRVKLESNALGQIAGRYALESERPGGIPTLLSGSFRLDQSYLPEIERSARRLAVEIGSSPEIP
jgi:hypothetical protein